MPVQYVRTLICDCATTPMMLGMLLEISTTHRPASDLGYLLHKNPARLQSFDLSFGRAHVYYPQVSPERCTAALLLDVDPVGLVRGKNRTDGWLEQYVNDRPYVASSFLSVAIARVLREAMAGRSKERQALAESLMPLEARITVLPSRGGEGFLRRLFEPLGYVVHATRHALDDRFPSWGESPYFTVTLEATTRLSLLLTHLYVLVPVLDDEKHYWVGDEEVEKLLRFGAGWLETHPEREEITRRYLKHRRDLARDAMAQLSDGEDPALEQAQLERAQALEDAVEKPLSLNEQRLNAVTASLKATGAARVLDLGCGEGKLLRLLLADKQFAEILGVDVSHRVLGMAHDRLNLERLPEKQRARIKLLQGSLTYRDKRLGGFDAAAIVEVIEHLDPPRLASLERNVFEFAKPSTVVLTTPNREYNAKWETLPAGKFRHADHRFEWTRQEFQDWAGSVAERFGYGVRFEAIGEVDPEVGSPTQMGVFVRNGIV
jgi:3' terminal RNA ribose 2'-O-methyltransferase Hen1